MMFEEVFHNTCTVKCGQCESMLVYVGVDNATVNVQGNVLKCRKCGKENVFNLPEKGENNVDVDVND